MEDTVTPEQRLKVAQALAVQEAMLEVMQEQQAEIIRRAAAKLKEIGLTVEGTSDGANI